MIVRHRAACQLHTALRSASTSASCSNTSSFASSSSSSWRAVLHSRQLHCSPLCRNDTPQPPQPSLSADAEAKTAAPAHSSPSPPQTIEEISRQVNILTSRIRYFRTQSAKRLAQAEGSTTDRETVQKELDAKLKVLLDEANELRRLKAEKRKQDGLGSRGTRPLFHDAEGERSQRVRRKQTVELTEEEQAARDITTARLAEYGSPNKRTPWIAQNRLQERDASIMDGTFRESIEDFLLSQPPKQSSRPPQRRTRRAKSAKVEETSPGEGEEQEGAAEQNERFGAALSAELFASDPIAQAAHEYVAADAEIAHPSLDRIPYVRRKQTPYSTTPLWKVLEEDPHFLEQYPEEEHPYMFSHLPPSDTWSEANIAGQRSGMFAKARYFLTRRDTIKRFVDRMGLEELSAANGGQKITVIEAVPGAGTVTRELLTRDCVGKVISLEERRSFRDWVAGLRDDPTVVDSQGVPARDKLHVKEQSGYKWSTYDEIIAEGHLDHLKPIREQTSTEATGPPPPLVFVAQLPNSVLGDQFFVQIMSAIGHGGWLYQYGRVKVVCIIPDSMAKKALAPTNTVERAKISVLSRIVSDMKVILPNIGLQPRAAHIYPPTLRALQRSLASHIISNENMASPAHHVEMSGVEFIPKQRQVWAWRQASAVVEDFDETNAPEEYNQGIVAEEFECLEFLMRNLFVLKRHAVADSLEKGYPGAKGILPRISKQSAQAKGNRFSTTAPFSRSVKARLPTALVAQLDSDVADALKNSDDNTELYIYHPAAKLAPMPKMEAVEPDRMVVMLTEDQWITLARVFERWPFRPKILQEESAMEELSRNKQIQD